MHINADHMNQTSGAKT